MTKENTSLLSPSQTPPLLNDLLPLENHSIIAMQIPAISEISHSQGRFTRSHRSQLFQSIHQCFFPNITSALIDEIEANSPSFLVIDAGMQDIVNFALNGAEGNTEVNDPNTFQMGDLLTESAFKSKLEELTNTLLNQSNETKGILMNIPDILNFPMFIKLSFDLTPYIGNNNTF